MYIFKTNNRKERKHTIKRIKKILLILLGVIAGLPLLMSLLMMLPGIQTRLVETITERLSKDLDTEISIGRVQALPFSGIRLQDFLVRDMNNDTLFFAPRVHSEIDYFSIRKKHLYLGRVTFQDPDMRLTENGDGMNFTFLIDSIGKMQPDTVKWHYSVRGLRVKGGSLSFSHSLFENPSFKTDGLLFSDLEIDIARTSGVNDSLNFKLNHLSLTEQSGLTLESAGAEGKIREDKISIDNIFLKTAESDFRIDGIQLPVNPGKNTEQPGRRFAVRINKIRVSPFELGLLFNNLPGFHRPVSLSGDIHGSLKNLKGRDINVSFGENTRIQASFDLTDFTDFSETFIFMDVAELRTSASDINKVVNSSNGTTSQSFRGLNNLGIISFSGNLAGFMTNLVAFGKFETALGIVSTDLGMKFLPGDSYSFNGQIKTTGFELSEVFNLGENMGGLTMNMEVNGAWENQSSYFVDIEGVINTLELNNYTYRDADINGVFTHQRFDGSVALSGPNGVFRFDGEVDASSSKPKFKFNADLENVLPDRLNLIPQMKDGVVTMSLDANFEGDNIDNLSGAIKVFDGLIYTPETSLEIDTLSLLAFREGDEKKILLNSDFIEGELSGQYNFENIRLSFLDMLAHFLPSLAAREPADDLPLNRFNFEFSFKGFDRVLGLLYPGLEMAYEGILQGEVDSKNHLLDIYAAFDNMRYNGFYVNNFEFHANARDGTDLESVTRAKEISKGNLLSLYNFSVHHKAGRDSLGMSVFWNNWDKITNSGALYTNTTFRRGKNDNFYFSTRMQPSTVILNDSVWQISEAKARYTPKSFSIDGLEFLHADQRVTLDGFLHRESMDGMRLVMDNIDLSQLFGSSNQEFKHRFGGIIDGSMEMKDFYRTPLWSANFSVDNFSFNGDTVGFFTVGSRWDPDREALVVNTSVIDGQKSPLEGAGYIHPEKNNVDLALNLDGLSVSFLSSFIGNILQDFKAEVTGQINLSGSLKKPYLTGRVNVDRGNFDVDLLQTSYEITDSVWFYPNEIRFKDMTVKDRHGKQANFKGSIYHDAFHDMIYNLRMDVKEMLVLDTKLKDNPNYYGTVYANGNFIVTGSSQNIELNIEAGTLGNTRFFIPMADAEKAVQSNFIRFVSDGQSRNSNYIREPEEEKDYNVDLSGLELNMEIDVTPEARIEIIFDSTIGDLLSASGEGNIQVQIDRQGNVSLFGDYNIERGEYLFSLQNLVNKKFAINEGGTVSWQGNPGDARIDVTAVYKLKAPLSDLLGPMSDVNNVGDQNDIQRRIPIDCNLMLNGPLEKPGIKFGIEAPTLSDSRESYMLDFIASEDEMNRQVLSLLVLNRFYTPDYLRMGSQQGMQTNNAALVTTTEMLSNQLSRWLSNISRDVDVGVSYRPEDNISSEEIEVALSTQVFNDRVTINGNVGYGKYQTNTSKMVGDFDMNVKLNPSGTLRAKAYTRSNDDIIYETSPTTQGIGVTFKEEFDRFTELLYKYWKALSGGG